MIYSMYRLRGKIKDPASEMAFEIPYKETEYKRTSSGEVFAGLDLQKTTFAIETPYQFPCNVKQWQFLDENGELKGRVQDMTEKPFNLLQTYKRDKRWVLFIE